MEAEAPRAHYPTRSGNGCEAGPTMYGKLMKSSTVTVNVFLITTRNPLSTSNKK